MKRGDRFARWFGSRSPASSLRRDAEAGDSAPAVSGAGRWSGKAASALALGTALTASLALAEAPAPAEKPAAEEKPAASEKDSRVAIHFADLNGIDDWRVAEDGSLLIEGRNHRWYRATFFGTCPGIRFASTIGFVTDSTGDLDRFSSILVDGQRCYFRTLERIEPPTGPSAPPSAPRESGKDAKSEE